MSVSIGSKLVSGDTWIFTFSHASYLAPAWDASIYFENVAASFSATATDNGADHAFSIPAATTANFQPGRYKWTVRATDGTTVTSVATGWLEVLINPAAAGTRDTRSWARRTLDAVEATILRKATADQMAMTIRDRSLSRIPLPELVQLRTDLRNQVRIEEQGESMGLGRDIKVRFSRG